MKTFNNRPIFLINVDDESSTITTVSLVDNPAMELPMFCFSKEDGEKEFMSFSLQDEVRHNIISCIVRTDYPILRVMDGESFYILFNRETSEKLCQRLMKDGFQQNISLDHNHQLIDGIQLQELFIKDSEKGINPAGFEEAADGSLFGVYHISDEGLWQDCLSGKFGGVSLESYFRLESFSKVEDNNNNIKKNSMSKIKEALKRLLMEFNNLSTDKAELFWEEDSELMVGYKVFVEEGDNKVPAPDGEYISDENVIKVENGVVTEIEKKDDPQETAEEVQEEMKEETKEEVQEEMAEEVQEEVQETKEEVKEEVPEDKEDDRIPELEKRISDLETLVQDLVAKIAEIAASPAAAPVMEEFEQVKNIKTTGDKSLDKRLAIARALKSE